MDISFHVSIESFFTKIQLYFKALIRKHINVEIRKKKIEMNVEFTLYSSKNIVIIEIHILYVVRIGSESLSHIRSKDIIAPTINGAE